MARLLLSRLIQLPILLLIIYTLTLSLVWIAPGSPLEDPDKPVPEEVIEDMKARYNMNSFGSFYGSYLVNALQLDFGPSLRYPDVSVNQILKSALPVSLQLGLLAIIFALILGVTAGVTAAVYRGGPLDWASMGIAMLGISLPNFVSGMMLLLVFGIGFGWFAPGWGSLNQMILPALTLSLPFAAYIARLTRLGMLDTLNQDFIRTAKAKGLSKRVVVFKHALKVAFLPVLSFLGPATAAAMTGSFVVEKVFNIPGMGVYFIDAVRDRDISLILAVTLVYATMLIVFNMMVDIAYAWVDPRIDLTEKNST